MFKFFQCLYSFNVCIRMAMISFGVQGAEETELPKIESIIRSTLHEAMENGFEKERVDGILHQIELSLKHVRKGCAFDDSDVSL